MAKKAKAMALKDEDKLETPPPVPAAPKAKRLEQAEMRRLERISNEISHGKTCVALQEQIHLNVQLKIENLKMVMKNYETEALRVKDKIKSEQDLVSAKAKELEGFAAQLRVKYELEGQELRYDMLSGLLP